MTAKIIQLPVRRKPRDPFTEVASDVVVNAFFWAALSMIIVGLFFKARSNA